MSKMTKQLEYEIQRCFDNASADAELARILEAHPYARPYVDELKAMRAGAALLAGQAPAIQDTQMHAFLAGVREGVEAAPQGHRGLWAALSLTAAALIVSFSAFMVMAGQPRDVRATVIDSAETEIENATVRWAVEDDGVATVWIEQVQEDIQ